MAPPCTASFIFLLITFTDTVGMKVNIELTHPHAHVEPEFLSVTLDSSILGPPKWRTFSFRFVKLCKFLYLSF